MQHWFTNWISATHSSSGLLGKPFKSCSIFKPVLLGSWWGRVNTIILHPILNPSTGSRSLWELYALLTRQCIYGDAPLYLKELIIPHTPIRNLRSVSAHFQKTPKTKLHTMGDLAFCSAAPRLWHALPGRLRMPQTVNALNLVYLFMRAVGPN